MWTIERTRTPRARVLSTGGDLPNLAETIGLQVDEAAGWLTNRHEVGSAVHAEIPNTIVFLWAGDLGSLGKLAVGWSMEMAYSRSLGFHVVELDFRDGRSDYDAVDALAGYAQNGELHGLVTTGHGSPFGFGTGGVTAYYHPKGWHFTYEEIEQALPYHLAVVVLNACLSGFSRLDSKIRTARNFLISRVEPGYEITAGGRDLVAKSPRARFFGQCGILYPVLEGGRIRRLLRPGDQGTVVR